MKVVCNSEKKCPPQLHLSFCPSAGFSWSSENCCGRSFSVQGKSQVLCNTYWMCNFRLHLAPELIDFLCSHVLADRLSINLRSLSFVIKMVLSSAEAALFIATEDLMYPGRECWAVGFMSGTMFCKYLAGLKGTRFLKCMQSNHMALPQA